MTDGRRSTGTVLVAEDEVNLALVLEQYLTARGHQVTVTANGEATLAALARTVFDVALLDIAMPAPDGIEVLARLAAEPDAPAVIVTTGNATIDNAVQAMRLGAFAYVVKPYRMPELDALVGRALTHRLLANENDALRDQVARAEGGDGFRTMYAPLKAVLALARDAATRDTPVLITGEPGTGKCALAREVHARSTRARGPFNRLTGGVLGGPDGDALLFGGTPNGGRARRGVLAGSGTAYLDDVFSLCRGTQTRLARALSTGRYLDSADGHERAVRARIVCASSAPAAQHSPPPNALLVEMLGGVVISLPTLRERAVDIPLLAEAFLQSSGDSVPCRLDADALELLRAYDWPGNVAELRAVIERARLLSRDGVIRAVDLPITDANGSLELADVERRHIAAVLRHCGWHQGRAAQALDISPKTLYRKMRSFGLVRPRRTSRQ